METIKNILALPETERNNAALDVLGLPQDDKSRIFIMGAKYSPGSDALALLDHIVTLPRFTYRHGFEPVGGFSTDSGWGCMMRTGQMAVCASLISAMLPAWRLSSSEFNPLYRQILRYFADAPSAPLSIQKIATTGVQLDVAIGQWFGPTTICHVIRRLAKEAEDFPIRVHVAQDGVVSLPDLFETSGGWEAPVLLLVPLRLGLNQIDTSLAAMASDTLTWPLSRGILGGKPRASYYFVAAHGEELLYLDPHTPQPTVHMDAEDFPTESFHSHSIHRLHVSGLDPSMALAFFCATAEDCLALQHLVADQGRLSNSQALFTFVEERGKTYDFSDEEKPSTAERGDEWDML